MSAPGSLKPFQDLPPPEGFSRIDFKRHLPFRGPAGWVLLLGATAVIGFGLYRAGQGNLIKWELKRERLQARYHIEPFILAERERFYLRALEESERIQDIILRDSAGPKEKLPTYHNAGFRHGPLLTLQDPARHRYPGTYMTREGRPFAG